MMRYIFLLVPLVNMRSDGREIKAIVQETARETTANMQLVQETAKEATANLQLVANNIDQVKSS